MQILCFDVFTQLIYHSFCLSHPFFEFFDMEQDIELENRDDRPPEAPDSRPESERGQWSSSLAPVIVMVTFMVSFNEQFLWLWEKKPLF